MKPSQLRQRLEVRVRKLHQSHTPDEQLQALREIHDLTADALRFQGHRVCTPAPQRTGDDQR